mmetsp:Transcript_5278/g.10822  ORF Transcript_5278/g.10822 Transcript_5278/m.10822 type:complete len:107 (-) Transcript_5278:1929-2249(-)
MAQSVAGHNCDERQERFWIEAWRHGPLRGILQLQDMIPALPVTQFKLVFTPGTGIEWRLFDPYTLRRILRVPSLLERKRPSVIASIIMKLCEGTRSGSLPCVTETS